MDRPRPKLLPDPIGQGHAFKTQTLGHIISSSSINLKLLSKEHPYKDSIVWGKLQQEPSPLQVASTIAKINTDVGNHACLHLAKGSFPSAKPPSLPTRDTVGISQTFIMHHALSYHESCIPSHT